jgi:DnaJ like chaperone protein
MAWTGKLIGGGLGWAIFGPLGALLGGVIGNAFDQQAASQTQERSYDYRRRDARQDPRFAGPQPGAFAVALMALCAHVIKADGQARGEEVREVRSFVQRLFPNDAADLMQLLKGLLEQDIDLPRVCAQIQAHLGYYERLELLQLLVAIARADGQVHPAELRVLMEVGQRLGLHAGDLRVIFASLANPAPARPAGPDPYPVLGLSRDATDDDLKKAYRALAKKFHPDRVTHLGEEVRAHSEQKFKELQAAWDAIKRERGL